MGDLHRPAGWPETVGLPGTDDWEKSAVAWILDEVVPYLRTSPVCRYPEALAAIARHVTAGAVEGARDGYRQARTELGEAIPPHAIDITLSAYREEGRRLAEVAKALDVIGRALRGEPV